VVYSCHAIGPLFLAFIPVLAFARGKPPGVGWLIGFVGLLVLAWFVVMQLSRYLLPCLALACVLVGYSLRLCWSYGWIVRAPATAMLAVSCFVAMAGMLFYALPQVGVALGLESHDAYLYRMLEVYRASDRINSGTPPTAKVATYGEPRVFYIDREVMWADPGHHQMMAYARMTSGQDLVARYRELRITHILLAPDMVRRLHDRADTSQLLLLFRDAERRGLLREWPPGPLDSYMIGEVNYQQQLGGSSEE